MYGLFIIAMIEKARSAMRMQMQNRRTHIRSYMLSNRSPEKTGEVKNDIIQYRKRT
jgi:hypothetical protein